MPALDDSYGVTELGILFSTMLFGVMIVQCYTYYQADFKDGWPLQTLVIFVLIVETLHTMVLWANLYHLTVTNFGDLNALLQEHWTIRLSIPLATLITCSAQCFFAMRVYLFSRQIWFTILSCALALFQFGSGIAMAVLVIHSNLREFTEQYGWFILTNVCVADIVDLGNALMLCYWLNKTKAEINVKRSQRIIDRLILWSLETSLITSFTETLTVILMFTMKNSVCMFFFNITAKLYSNSLLACLNGRVLLRESQHSAGPVIVSTMKPTKDTLRHSDDIESTAENGVRVDVLQIQQ